jgi:hypothetical protein
MALDIPVLAALVTNLYKYTAYYKLENLPDRVVYCENVSGLRGPMPNADGHC